MSTQLTVAEMECGIIFKHEFTVFDIKDRETDGLLTVVKDPSNPKHPFLVEISSRTPLEMTHMRLILSAFLPCQVYVNEEPFGFIGTFDGHPTYLSYRAHEV
jgi:hypothetical protein